MFTRGYIPENPMKPQFSYGFPMVFLWFSYGSPMFHVPVGAPSLQRVVSPIARHSPAVHSAYPASRDSRPKDRGRVGKTHEALEGKS